MSQLTRSIELSAILFSFSCTPSLAVSPAARAWVWRLARRSSSWLLFPSMEVTEATDPGPEASSTQAGPFPADLFCSTSRIFWSRADFSDRCLGCKIRFGCFVSPCSGSRVRSYLHAGHEAAGVPPLLAEVFTRFSFLLDHLLAVLAEDLLGTPVELRVLDEPVPVGEPGAAQRAAVRLLTLHTDYC